MSIFSAPVALLLLSGLLLQVFVLKGIANLSLYGTIVQLETYQFIGQRDEILETIATCNLMGDLEWEKSATF